MPRRDFNRQRGLGVAVLILILVVAGSLWHFRSESLAETLGPSESPDQTRDEARRHGRPKGRVVPPVAPDSPPETPTDEDVADSPSSIAIDDRVERGEGSLRVEVTDAAGAPLEWWRVRDGKARLWRRVGAYWDEEDLRLNPSRDAVESWGTSGAGLEPGRHELEVSLADYGRRTIGFTMGKGQSLMMTESMPGAHRVIQLRFETPEGRLIPVLDSLPEVVSGKSEELPGERKRAPSVLRSPPAPYGAIGMGGGVSSSSHRRSMRSNRYYATDDGIFCVGATVHPKRPVVVRYRPRTLFVRLEESPDVEIEAYPGADNVFVLTPVADYDERVAKATVENIDDPGRRLATNRPPRESRFREITPEGDPFDLSELGKSWGHRVVIDLPPTFHPRFFWLRQNEGNLASLSPERGLTPDHLRHARGYFYSDVRPESRYVLAIGDGAFLHRDARFQAMQPGELTRIAPPRGDLRPVRVSVHVPRTLAAWGRVTTILLLPRGEDPLLRWHDEARPMARTAPDCFAIDTFIGPEQVTWMEQGAVLQVGFSGRDDRIQSVRGTKFQFHRDEQLTIRIPVDDQLENAIREGHLRLDLGGVDLPDAHRGLILRAIDATGAGLPWVAGSLISYEDDALARRMRLISTRLNADGRRDAVERSWFPRLAEDDLADAPVTGEGLDQLLGIDATEAYPDLAMQSRLARQGAWYDTRRKAESDDHGYLRIASSDLVPERRFVLYLWSASRDDLEPDLRIVFTAQTGITDLGVVVLEAPR